MSDELVQVHPFWRSAATGGVIFGLGMGGFFDGILLHQVLQWHNVASGLVDDGSLNVFLDGVFHAMMYVAVVVGVVLFWRAHRHGQLPVRWTMGWVLLGAGAFHLFDGVVNHWVLGLHRIRPGPDALLWDMVFLVFGVVLFAFGFLLTRQGSGGLGNPPDREGGA